MDISTIFMMPGIYIWTFLGENIFTFFADKSVGLNMFMAFWMALIFWSWVYHVLALIVRKTFGFQGKRNG